MKYALVAMLRMDGTVMQGASRELEDMDAVCEALKEMEPYEWSAVTLVHIEDLPRMMEGTVPHV